MPARATGSRFGSYLGRKPVFDEALIEFAEIYADQNERDYEAREGRIEIDTDTA